MPIAPIKPGGWSNDDPVLTPAHMNAFQAALVGAGDVNDRLSAELLRMALIPRRISTTLGAGSFGVAHWLAPTAEGRGSLFIKGGTPGSLIVNDGAIVTPAGDLSGTIGSVLAAVFGYPSSNERILAIHTGGNKNNFTDDYGATWTAGGAMPFTPYDVIWNGANTNFVAVSSGNTVSWSNNGTSWSGGISHSLAATGLGGIAQLASGRIVICGRDGTDYPRFTRSDDGGATWSDTGGFPATWGPAYLNEGYIAGNGGSKIWHAGWLSNPAAFIRISTSTDGTTWTPIADLGISENNLPPAILQPTGLPRLFCCPQTGMLVLFGCDSADGVIFAIASLDEGVTWSDPVFMAGVSLLSGLGVANGKIFHGSGTELTMSDGVRWRSHA